MKRFLIITNAGKDPDLTLTKKIQSYVETLGGACPSLECHPSIIRNEENDRLIREAECVLVLGGDGTLLKAAKEVANKNIPIIGINLGTLGFLTEIERDSWREAIDKLFADQFHRQERMMLRGLITRKGMEDKTQLLVPALNDIAITRSGSLQIIRFSIYVNHKFLCKMDADGIIIATPTGSTGYNMSAGGPIVEPEAEMILLTPICAHNLSARSIVLKADDVVEIEIDQDRDGSPLTVEANSDGNEKISMVTGDKILIQKAEETTSILILNKVSFVETLHKKMSD